MSFTMDRQDPKGSPRPVLSKPPPSGVMLRGLGRVSLVRRAARTVLCTVVGQVGPDHVDWLIAELGLHVADGTRHVFIDASRLDAGGTLFKQRLQRWLVGSPGVELVRALRLAPLDEEAETSATWIEHRDSDTFQRALADELR